MFNFFGYELTWTQKNSNQKSKTSFPHQKTLFYHETKLKRGYAA
jgi:hypothetical protein